MRSATYLRNQELSDLPVWRLMLQNDTIDAAGSAHQCCHLSDSTPVSKQSLGVCLDQSVRFNRQRWRVQLATAPRVTWWRQVYVMSCTSTEFARRSQVHRYGNGHKAASVVDLDGLLQVAVAGPLWCLVHVIQAKPRICLHAASCGRTTRS